MLCYQDKVSLASLLVKFPSCNQLKVIFNENLPDYELSFCRSHDELTLLQLRRAVLVVADISGEIAHPRAVCERYYSLMTQYRDIHWVFMVSDSSIRWPLSY